jgi:hypothetical protein
VGKAEHTPEPNQHEDALMMAYGLDSRGLLRDWNEEYQVLMICADCVIDMHCCCSLPWWLSDCVIDMHCCNSLPWWLSAF